MQQKEEITMAARQSNSWEFISSFPDGMETIVGDRGIKYLVDKDNESP